MVGLCPAVVGQDDHARQFYEAEALRGGWSVRQLDRQMEASSTNVRPCPKTRRRCWSRGSGQAEDAVTPNDAIKDPYVLEFLDLKDEYSESDLKRP